MALSAQGFLADIGNAGVWAMGGRQGFETAAAQASTATASGAKMAAKLSRRSLNRITPYSIQVILEGKSPCYTETDHKTVGRRQGYTVATSIM